MNGLTIPRLGWTVDPAYWNRGLATEAAAECIRCGLEHLDVLRIVSICTPENAASRRVMEKLGLTFLTEKTHRELGVTLWIHAIRFDDPRRAAQGPPLHLS